MPKMSHKPSFVQLIGYLKKKIKLLGLLFSFTPH